MRQCPNSSCPPKRRQIGAVTHLPECSCRMAVVRAPVEGHNASDGRPDMQSLAQEYRVDWRETLAPDEMSVANGMPWRLENIATACPWRRVTLTVVDFVSIPARSL